MAMVMATRRLPAMTTHWQAAADTATTGGPTAATLSSGSSTDTDTTTAATITTTGRATMPRFNQKPCLCLWRYTVGAVVSPQRPTAATAAAVAVGAPTLAAAMVLTSTATMASTRLRTGATCCLRATRTNA